MNTNSNLVYAYEYECLSNVQEREQDDKHECEFINAAANGSTRTNVIHDKIRKVPKIRGTYTDPT